MITLFISRTNAAVVNFKFESKKLNKVQKLNLDMAESTKYLNHRFKLTLTVILVIFCII